MSNDQRIRSVKIEEMERLSATMALAFSADPIARWVMMDGKQFVDVMIPLVGAFGGRAAVQRGTAHVIGDFLGAAIWLPPGAHVDDEAMGEIFSAHIEGQHLNEVAALFEEMANYHPKEPHWYLPLIGVDPPHQRRGYGEALLQHAVAACDHDRAVAYLEATNPSNVSLYQRHGFESLGRIVVGDSPPLIPMIRKPR